jgi:hypothetical protein
MRPFAEAAPVGLHSQSKGANRTPPDRPFACLPEAQGAHPLAATGLCGVPAVHCAGGLTGKERIL